MDSTLEAHYLRIASLIQQRAGIVLGNDKNYIIEAKLLPFAKKHGFDSLEALVHKITNNTPKLLDELTEWMTINESFFFRDLKVFEQIIEVALPRFRHKKPIRIWCAACSNGQEPYSLAIALMERAATETIHFEIVATDLASGPLKRAQEGVYSQFEVQRGLPTRYLLKYFQQTDDGWNVKNEVKTHIKFTQLNLLDSYHTIGPCDLILCRNVLIYFDAATKQKVLEKLAAQLTPQGVIVLGSAETIFSTETRLIPLKDTISMFSTKP